MASKPTKATRYIHEAANRVKNSGISVDWDSGMEIVSISCEGEDDIFMQGEGAGEFIAQIDAMTKRYPSLDDYTAACALAEPYAECIWN